MEKKLTIKFKPKYNLTIGWLAISVVIFILFFQIRECIRDDFSKDSLGTFFGVLVFFVFITIPFVLAILSTCRYEIENNLLKTKLLFGIVKEELDMNDIVKIKLNERMLFSKDPRIFMGIKKKQTIELEIKNQETVTIDGNVLKDEDYFFLKKELYKYQPEAIRHPSVLKKMTEEQKKLYLQIDKILWEDWDPIGVNEFEDARDEYSSYAAPVFSLCIQNKSDEEIAQWLYQIETKQMGGPGNLKRCMSIAIKINQLNKV